MCSWMCVCVCVCVCVREGEEGMRRRVLTGPSKNQHAHHTGQSGDPIRPDPELVRLQQADEGRASPTADGRTREKTPTASRTSPRQAAVLAGPGMGLATLSSETVASETGSERDTPRETEIGQSTTGQV